MTEKDWTEEELLTIKKGCPSRSFQTLRSLVIAGPDYIADRKAQPLLDRELIEVTEETTKPLIHSPAHEPSRRVVQKRYRATLLGIKVARV